MVKLLLGEYNWTLKLTYCTSSFTIHFMFWNLEVNETMTSGMFNLCAELMPGANKRNGSLQIVIVVITCLDILNHYYVHSNFSMGTCEQMFSLYI